MMLHTKPRRKGAVLIMVMVVIVVLLLIGYQYLNLMLAEGNASIVSGRLAQARHLADSGVHFANFVLAFPQTQNLSDSPDSFRAWYGNIYDNSDIFHYRPINGPNGVKGYFSIVSPRDPMDTTSSTGYRFGVEDEGGKINLNAVRDMIKKRIITKETLLAILGKMSPNINEEQANAVINWTDPAGTPDSGESAYYSSLGYQSKAGPYDSLEELLMVKGWTPKQLYGNDKNRNGKIDPDEDDGSGQVDLGLQRYFTTYSRELNVDSTGQQKINLNNTDLVTLKSQLDAAVGEEISNFIILARSGSGDLYPNTLAGKATALATAKKEPTTITFSGGKPVFDMQKLQSARTFDPNTTDLTKKKSLASLVNAVVGYRAGPGPGTPALIPSPLDLSDKDKARTNLALLFDKCTLSADYEIPARININTCPVDVLTALGFIDTIAEKLIETRPTVDMDPSAIPYYKTPAWLLTEAEIDPTMFTQFSNFITTYSQVYRFQVVGYYEFRGPQVRLEVVVDANNGRPRILYWRDLTDLGKGYNFSQNRGGQ